MAKPQQPELRRSERVPALSPDASEAVLSAETKPSVDSPQGPVPEDQQPGHRPETDSDKPDLDAMAERLGVPSEGDEPDDAPHVEPDDTVEEIEARADERRSADTNDASKTRVKVGLVFFAPAFGYVVIRGIVRALRNRR